jgi:hypothetical protein
VTTDDPSLFLTPLSIEEFSGHLFQDARRDEPIAGFFSSSLLEVAAEALERMKPEDGGACVRMVCNSCLNPLDVQTARAAKWGMHREWCASLLQGSGEGGSEVPDENTCITRLK